MHDKALQSQPEPRSSTRPVPVDDEPIFIEHGRGLGLETVDRERALENMRQHGAVLFRGFKAGAEEFVTFSSRFCIQFLEHGAPEFRPQRSADGTVAQVLIGNGSVALHAEMNYSPARPDVLWLHCTQPAESGGETLLADGRRMLAQLSDATRKLFEQNRIRYRHHMTPEMWKFNTKMTDRATALMLLNLVPDVVATAVGEDDIQMDFTAEAIRPTGRSGQPGFVNSIANVMEYTDRTDTRVMLADGQPIPEEALRDIDRAGRRVQVPVRWQAQDVLLIDNSRMMHGRGSFTGNTRKIDVRFGVLCSEDK